MRVGIGYDIHALKAGRRLVLGGVLIPYRQGLAGHSDGDVLYHAIVDAILGAAGEGDIGDFFPDTDLRYQGANSHLFIKKALEILKKKKLKLTHLDSIILAEAPKLSAVKKKIKENVARVLGLELSHVGVKAKTHEGFGAVGKKQAIACQVVVSLEPLKGK